MSEAKGTFRVQKGQRKASIRGWPNTGFPRLSRLGRVSIQGGVNQPEVTEPKQAEQGIQVKWAG